MAILTFLTDFGTADYYVAAVKGVVLRLAPGSTIVDVSHEVAPGDVAGAAFLLGAAVPWFPDGAVHLAVVDPGVGTSRRILAAQLASGWAVLPDSSWVVLPDNGLLTPLLDREAVTAVRSVERTDLFLSGPGRRPGQTFHGRDRFAPVAAWLLRGDPFEALGPEVLDPVRLPGEPPGRASGLASGQVVHVDRYGNLITDIPDDWLPDGPCCADVEGRTVRVRAGSYAGIPAGETAMIPGSLGTIEFSLNQESLARRWGLGRGAAVRITWAMS